MQVATSDHSAAHNVRLPWLLPLHASQIRTVGTMTSEYQSDVYRAVLKKHAEPQIDQQQPTPFFVSEVELLREVLMNAVGACAI